jgi:hypothetical protein
MRKAILPVAGAALAAPFLVIGSPVANAGGSCPAGWTLVNNGNTCQSNVNPSVIEPAIPDYAPKPIPAAPAPAPAGSIPAIVHQGCGQAGVC